MSCTGGVPLAPWVPAKLHTWPQVQSSNMPTKVSKRNDGSKSAACRWLSHRKRPRRERAASSAAVRFSCEPPSRGQLAGPLPSELSPLAAGLTTLPAVPTPCAVTAWLAGSCDV